MIIRLNRICACEANTILCDSQNHAQAFKCFMFNAPHACSKMPTAQTNAHPVHS